MIKIIGQIRPQNSGLRGKDAFSLLEVLMAMAILATAMLAAYQGVIQTLDTDIQSRFEQLAPMLAQQKLAAVYQPKPLNPTFQKGNFEAPYGDYRWNARIQPVAGAGFFGEGILWQIDIGISHLSLTTTYTLRTYRKSFVEQRGPARS